MSDETMPPSLTQRIIARLRGKKRGTVDEEAAKAKAGAEGMVRAVSDPNAPGVIQRRLRLYKSIEEQTKEE